MKTFFPRFCCALFAAFALAPVAHAEGFRASVSALSSYVWRGLPESSGYPVAQATASYHAPFGFYARAFVSTLDYQGAHVRADFTAGAREMTNVGLGINLGETAYRFDASDLDFAETFVRLRFADLTGGIYQDWQHDNTYVEAGYNAGLGSGFHFILHGGHTFGHTIQSYNDYGLGVAKTWPAITVGVFLTATSLAPSGLGDTRVAVVFTKRWGG